ncbi:MAG: dihydropteroate synthase [Cyclobacteriaceae bacterium]|nr:dihydropteroate synthase [Cyclobacteriaceae bacterium]
MGILNATSDSFYEGSRVTTEDKILLKAEKMLKAGATFLDIGGFSTRPNAENVSETKELKRVIPFIKKLSTTFPEAYISIDTFRPNVATEAVNAGASIINDVSGGQDEAMFETVAKLKVPYILMHMRGKPTNMMTDTNYKNIITEVVEYFVEKTNRLKKLGHLDIIIDPGFGFSKNLEQNYELLNGLRHLHMVGFPVLIGVSRKSMIYKLLKTTPEMALNGTNILNFASLERGAKILRVHDVKEAQETIKLFSALQH